MQAVDGVIFHPLFISVLNLMDTLLRTSLLTLSAAYTFRTVDIFGNLYCHWTEMLTFLTAYTFSILQMHLIEAEAVKKGVKCPKRT